MIDVVKKIFLALLLTSSFLTLDGGSDSRIFIDCEFEKGGSDS